jgi:probable F420-dependent oxidoreductase
MRIGLHLRATDRSMPIVDFAIAAEQRGFQSIHLAEHTHVPVATPASRPALGGTGKRRQVDPAVRGLYARIWDPYIALACVAEATSLHVGTCIALVAQHHPLTLAKTVATLDQLSGGRFQFGVGTGWDPVELANHGFDPADRLDVFTEHLDALRAIWADDEASFAGRWVEFEPVFAWPKPRPEMPILLGCRPRPTGFELLASRCDGWIPQDFNPSAHLADQLAELQRHWDAHERPGRPIVAVMDAEKDPDSLAAALEVYRSLDVDEVMLDLPTIPTDATLMMLDELAAVCSFDK